MQKPAPPDLSALGGDHEDETFTGVEGDNAELRSASFSHCVFRNSSFQFAKLTNCVFEHCVFDCCNLSLLQMHSTKIIRAQFLNAKLSGINWSNASGIFSASFTGCMMDNGSFTSMNLSKYTFRGCSFRDASFMDTKLAHATFDDCDLRRCTFQNADLSHADFSTSYNYFISTDSNKLYKAIFSLPEAISLLSNFNIILK